MKIDEIVSSIEKYDISVDFRDDDWTLLVEILLENIEDYGKIKKINNYSYGVNLIFANDSKTLEVDFDDRQAFEICINKCLEYQKQNKLSELDSEQILEIFSDEYDYLI